MPKVQVNPQPPKKKLEVIPLVEEKLEPVAVDLDALDASQRPVIYEEVRVCGIPIPVESMKVTLARVKEWMGIETEAEYAARMVEENPGTKPEQYRFDPERMFTFKDVEGDLCTAWYNLDNRPFERKDALKVAQDVLNRCWAGPTTFPGETVNGETMVIGRTGANISLQHRGIGLLFAVQMWRKDVESFKEKGHWWRFWQEEPFLESLWVTGVSENQRVTTTVDQSRSRTNSDSIYTSQVFRHHPDGTPMTRKERYEHARMLENAEKLLWRRTNMLQNNRWEAIPSSSSVKQFADRHPRLVEAVRFVYSLNGPAAENARVFSKLKLNAGDCAAMLYLMGASATDNMRYREMDMPGEKTSDKGRAVVNFDLWGTAQEFWTLLSKSGKGENAKFFDVRKAIVGLVDPDDPSNTAKLPHKMAVLAKAWALFREDKPIDPSDLELRFNLDSDGARHLDGEDFADFGGIDTPDRAEKEKAPEQSAEELKQSIADARSRKAEEYKALVEQSKAKVKNEVKPTTSKVTAQPVVGFNGKKISQKDINAAQTAKAAKHDAEDAATRERKGKPTDQAKLRAKTRG